MIVLIHQGGENVKKTLKYNILAFIVTAGVHTALCGIYNMTYYKDGFNPGRLPYWPLLITFFLASPLCYYSCGRLFNGKASKIFYQVMIWASFGIMAVFGVITVISPEFAGFYRIINAPSYMYYTLFYDSVFYIQIPVMVVASLFPAIFLRMGYLKRPRENNEIKMEDINADKKQKAQK